MGFAYRSTSNVSTLVARTLVVPMTGATGGRAARPPRPTDWPAAADASLINQETGTLPGFFVSGVCNVMHTDLMSDDDDDEVARLQESQTTKTCR